MSDAKYEFIIDGIYCLNCVSTIESHLKKCQNVKTAKVDPIDKSVIIHVANNTDTTKSYLIKELTDIGYDPTEPPPSEAFFIDNGQKEPPVSAASLKQKKNIRQHWLKAAIGILTGATLLILAISGVGIPLAAMIVIAAVSSALTIYLGRNSYKAAWRDIKTRNLTMDSLFSLSTLISVGVSIAAFFVPGLPQLFDAALMLFGFRHAGLAIEETTRRELAKNFSYRKSIPEKTAVLTEQSVTQERPVTDLEIGQTIIVYTGQPIPVDGECLDDEAYVFTTNTKGSTLSQKISKGTLLYQGAIVSDEQKYIRIKVKAKADNSYYAFLDERIKQAKESQNQAPLQSTATKITKYFIPTIIGVAIIAGLIAGFLFSPVTAVCCAAAILVSACPCTFGFATPRTFAVGMDKAAKHGVYFNDSKALEDTAQIDTVVFDLNGTLTTGTFTVTKSTIEEKLLPHLATIERDSKKLIGKAINQYLTEKGIQPGEFKEANIDYDNQSGVSATIDNNKYSVGNENMLKGVDFSGITDDLKEVDADQIIYMACNGKAIGYMLLQSPLRDGAKETIASLEKQGIQSHILTGVPQKTAERYARQLNIPLNRVKAEYVSESPNPTVLTKSGYIKSLKAAGKKVAMIGDSINDTSAFAHSHCSFAVKSIATDKKTQQYASAATYSTSLWPIASAFTVAKQTVNNVKQNLLFSLSYNALTLIVFGGILVAIGFAMNPALGAALMILQIGLILMNTKRFKQQTVPKVEDFQLKPSAGDSNSWQSTHKKTRAKIPCIQIKENIPAPISKSVPYSNGIKQKSEVKNLQTNTCRKLKRR